MEGTGQQVYQSGNNVASKGSGIVGLMNSIPTMIMGMLKKARSKKPAVSEVAAQEPLQQAPAVQATSEVQATTVTSAKSKMPKLKIPKKLIIVVVLVFIVLLVLMIVMRLLGGNVGGIIPSASSTPSPTPTPIVEVPSQYADDEDVAKIQERMEALDQELNSANFRDDRLRVPALDWDVNFGEK